MATTTRPPAAAEAWSLLGQLFQDHMKPRFMALASELDLSPPQMHALGRLDPDEPMPMSTLATLLHCDNSNVTGIVDRLEARGLVERRVAPHDRRIKMLALTGEGSALRGRLRERMDEIPAPLERLSAAEHRALRDLLRKALDDL